MNEVIKINELEFKYGNKRVLKNINLTINSGEIVGLIGENGAGKTTLLNILLGLLPSNHQVTILDGKPGEKKARQKIGSMLQGDMVLANVTVAEIIAEAAAQYDQPVVVAELLQNLGLKEYENKLLKSLSGGLMRRVTFALALVGNPELLFLDEPTVGMDSQARKIFWNRIKKLRDAGKTVVITSHYLEEIQQTADRLLILQNGKFSFQGTLPELQNKNKKTVIRFKTKLAINKFQLLTAVTSITPAAENWICLNSEDGDATLRALTPFLADISNISIQRESLEDIFLTMTTEGKRV
ncbi:MAG: ABC transporter ATP-binding protein [Liquorilactobacillus nagelii]|jgi:ABC-2 type transport system ATP-binding protein|uniref:Multidrug ABC transporter ATP-binding protein n=2 Tax=Liquorilactobacillus nagelii TaxID=82688 RepID=A0A3Q8D0F8_9LACO|nr:ABC transporter ATP-binding protein [Liquorilactobacillus nagelii]AUJ32147.1 multidrug ABC transporter ATP-binding protein [Liquorilactobacillus nagelii]MCC7615312.1 multidrug ABC transporter ATP-binding protein [Liquorilactobacillus nagelii]MCP9315439.1 ABC transporter ATP-binding protein [Liquorilactobacillus nagelii]ULQ49521.1 ABC transporter ATP-binding protein [Liquorilactobacillus nagelii]